MKPGKNIVLVTGGSSGIGRAIAEELGRTGYFVVVNFKSNETGACETRTNIESSGGQAIVYRADVSSRPDTENMFKSIEKNHGHISHVINNAGLTADGPLMLFTEDQWNSVIETNLNGVFNCSQLALRGMIHLGGGSIVNIVSPSGLRGQAGQCNYSAAKGGVVAFTKALAREMGRYNIRVNAVSPGIINTAMSENFIQKNGDKLLKEIPLARFGDPRDVALLVSFLISSNAGYITGQVISVDGGLI